MRNSTIALTAVIAVLAGGLAWSVSKPEQVQTLLHTTAEQTAATAADVKGDLTEAAAATDTDTTPVVADATPAEATPPAADNSAATPAPASNETTTAAATTTPPAETPPVTTATGETTNGGMTPANLDAASARLNGEVPAAGASDDAAAYTAAVPAEAPAATTPATTADADFKVDVDAAMADRSMGSPAAPVTVYDFSSLTCPHCAMFHNEVLPQIKTEYIDTGKVRWVFKGFPLNEPALKADMLARCAPDNQFMALEDIMYKNQQRWAFTDDPIANLSLLVRISGISESMFLSCVNNKELEDKLAAAIQANSTKYSINSTPTFVLNDGAKKIVGAGSFAGFALDLDTMLKSLNVEPPVHATPAATPL